MVSTDRVSEIFFELANSYRLDILLAVNQQSMKQSEIAKAIDLSIQETSRHLTRLQESNLVRRNIDGHYASTPFGSHIASLLPGVNFLATNAEYFASHDPSCIPTHLRYGLGLIVDYEKAGHVMESFRQTEELIKESREFIWIHSDQILSSSLPLIDDALERGVEFRVILPRELADHTRRVETYPQILESQHTIAHDRFIDDVEIIIVMSEKRGLLAFPRVDGSHDYLGFSFTNREALEWSKEYFLYLWDLSTQW